MMTNIKTVAIFERQFNAGRKMVIMTLQDNKIFSVKTLCDNKVESEARASNVTEANKVMLQMIEESM